ncbi:hypothetical protein KSF78_0007747 [Schistosoma japonicum]|nr:hypothetical protein KSF78_0007747 [Schistosoma japonicum]
MRYHTSLDVYSETNSFKYPEVRMTEFLTRFIVGFTSNRNVSLSVGAWNAVGDAILLHIEYSLTDNCNRPPVVQTGIDDLPTAATVAR